MPTEPLTPDSFRDIPPQGIRLDRPATEGQRKLLEEGGFTLLVESQNIWWRTAEATRDVCARDVRALEPGGQTDKGDVSTGDAMADRPTVGSELRAVLRQGAKDLQNNLIPAFPQNDRSVTETGSPLNPTPQQVTDGSRGSFDSALDGYSSAPGKEEKQKGKQMEIGE